MQQPKQHSIGVIKKVFTNKIVVEIFDPSQLNQNFMGDIYRCEGINTFITINKSYKEKFIYQIIALYEDERPLSQDESSKFSTKVFFEAIPIGEIEDGKFQFGMSVYPMIGNGIYLTLEEDFDCILNNSSDDKNYIQIGKLSSRETYYPKIDIDKLFTNHTCILGNTGSGKSTTMRRLLIELSKLTQESDFDKQKMNFYIFDIHDEYRDIPKVPNELVNYRSLKEISIPLEMLGRDDWLNLIIPSNASQLPILINALKLGNVLESKNNDLNWIKAFAALTLYESQQTDAVAKRSKILGILREIGDEDINNVLQDYNSQYGNFSGAGEKRFINTLNEYIEVHIGEVDPSVYLYEQLELANVKIENIDTLDKSIEIILLLEEAKGNTQIRAYCSPMITRIENIMITYRNNLFSNDPKRLELFNEILEHNDKAFEIINFSEVENDDLLFFSSFMLNVLFEQQKELRSTGEHKLVHFIFDEAHRYISENNNMLYNPTRMFEQIAKEGRKFGLFMILASQRPSELSKTVLSQCNNFIIHRIRNNVDLEQMRKSIPYITDPQLLRISYLRTGYALVVGEAFATPLELKITGDGDKNLSSTLKPSVVWK